MFEWNLSERWFSNDGAGPLVARITAVVAGIATMQRWHRKSPARQTRFELPVSYLCSQACGWKLQEPPAARRNEKVSRCLTKRIGVKTAELGMVSRP